MAILGSIRGARSRRFRILARYMRLFSGQMIYLSFSNAFSGLKETHHAPPPPPRPAAILSNATAGQLTIPMLGMKITAGDARTRWLSPISGASGGREVWTERALAPIAALREELAAEPKARMRKTIFPCQRWTATGPIIAGLSRVRIRCSAAGRRKMRMRRVRLAGWRRGRGELLLIGGAAHSPDHRMLATAIDSNGSEHCKIGIRDLETGDMLADELTDAQGDMVWSADSHILYTVLDDNHRPCRVMRHTVGTVSSEDVTVYEIDPGFFGIGKSESGWRDRRARSRRYERSEIDPGGRTRRSCACYWPAKPGSHTTYRITERR